jgi:hypothetical protein
LPLIAKVLPWLEKNNENNYSKYRSFAMHPIVEVHRLGNVVRKAVLDKKYFEPKLFMAFSHSDHIVSAKASEQFFIHYASDYSRCFIHYNGLNPHADPRVHYLNNTFTDTFPPMLRHNGLPFSPENTHYGLNGDYRDPKKNELLYNPQFDELAKAIVEFLG